jgi:hypothetical protein
MVQTRPVQPPRWDDFTIARQSLFQAAHEYLTAASELVSDARSIVNYVHGAQCVSTPPN